VIIGGIVGSNSDGYVTNCENQGKIEGINEKVGGICGYNLGTIQTSTNKKEIKSGCITGGICGYNEGIIDSCYNTAKVESTDGIVLSDGEASNSFSGGITGVNNGTINKCMNEGEVSGIKGLIAGIAGRNYGTVSYCCNSGNVTGSLVTGGIVGNNRGHIEYVYNIGNEIKGIESSHIGGIAGNQNTTSDAYIKYAYNTAKVSGTSNIGGIIGTVYVGTVSNVYNIGTINASTTTNVGQIYGSTYNTSSITNSDSTTEATMKNWTQTQINSNIGSGFIKKTNSLPIFNITVKNITF
jgi:hypothetical protein